MKPLINAREFIACIYRNIERKHLPLIAAGLAFYFVMSLVPALMLLTVAVSYLPLQNGMEGVTSFMAHLVPPQGMDLIERLPATIAPHRTGLLSFGIIATLWLTSKGVKGIISGLDIVYEVRVPRSLWINRILAFGLTFAFGLLLLLGILLTLAGPTLEGLLAAVVPVQSLLIKAWPYVQWMLAATFTFVSIEVLYLLAPNVPAAHRLTVPGAVIAASGMLVLSWALGFYFQYFGQLKLDRLYGILATPIALMIWLYWSAGLILIGAEINSTLQSRRKLRVSHTMESLRHRTDAA